MTNERNGKNTNKKVNILMLLTHNIWPLGWERGTPIISFTIKGFLSHNAKIYFLAGFHPILTENVFKKIYVDWFDAKWIKNIVWHKKGKIIFFAQSFWWFICQTMFFFKGFKCLLKHKIDLIYCWDAFTVPAAKILSKIYKIPLVTRFLGTNLHLYELGRFSIKIKGWYTVVGYKIPADLTIMTNDGTQGDRVLRQLGVDMKRVKFWMNGVDWSSFTKLPEKSKTLKKLGLNSRNKYLLTISRLAYWKHVERAILALPDVVQANPDIQLIIVGDGYQRKNLERLTQKLGITKYVKFIGAVPYDEIPNYFAVADIFLSFYDSSNVGNPLLEAMMSGKCIITLNNGDTGEFIKNGVNGILLEYENLPYLSKVIIELIADKERCKKLGNAAYKFAKKHFWGWDERIETEISAVKNILK